MNLYEMYLLKNLFCTELFLHLCVRAEIKKKT